MKQSVGTTVTRICVKMLRNLRIANLSLASQKVTDDLLADSDNILSRWTNIFL